MPRNERITVPLWRIAHARAGDKGDVLNVGVFARQPRFFSVLVEQVTEERIAALFAHRRPRAVRRHLLPKIEALNLVLEGVLEGGVNRALGLDAHGKTLSCLVLSLPVEVPAELLGQTSAERTPTA